MSSQASGPRCPHLGETDRPLRHATVIDIEGDHGDFNGQSEIGPGRPVGQTVRVSENIGLEQSRSGDARPGPAALIEPEVTASATLTFTRLTSHGRAALSPSPAGLRVLSGRVRKESEISSLRMSRT